MGDMEPKSRPRLGLDEVRLAAERVSAHLHKTPVLTSTHLNALAGRQLFFKAEHLQKTGSFKARGACNAVCLDQSGLFFFFSIRNLNV
ncbi:putative serine racemase [Portunus trituberculatus]|uniref:L-serine ammonia-lyase n=1 Tax=Portunus trituberculatus TaxID=210409 RepID=A0A5B7IZC2_PORTR|nr:putative serine racemase [Portunus trituberculatus]